MIDKIFAWLKAEKEEDIARDASAEARACYDVARGKTETARRALLDLVPAPNDTRRIVVKLEGKKVLVVLMNKHGYAPPNNLEAHYYDVEEIEP